LYKVTLAYQDDVVKELKIKYFDTVAVANSMCVLRTGFLFVAAEFGNHVLYQFQSAGDDGVEEEPMETGDTKAITFTPRPLKNLLLIDEMESLSPIIDCKIADVTREDTAQIYCACGRGRNSKLKVLRHGLPVTQTADPQLPAVPTGVWAVKSSIKDEYDKYIVASFSNGTLVLSIGELVEEVSNSGFLGNTATLCVALIGEDSLLQVHPNGLRHIRSDKRIHQWVTPGKKTIVHAAANSHQVVIALSGGELYYFELDATGQLIETDKKDLGREVACLDIAPVSEGRSRTRFLAVGDWDNTVRVLSLENNNCFGVLSVQALPTQAESLCLVEMTNPGDSSGTMFLNIGLKNGVLLRTVVDSVTGELTDTRTRFLGSRPVKLYRAKIRGANAVMALSSRTWIHYLYQSRFHLAPLSYLPLDSAWAFNSEQCPEGIIATAANTLRIITLDRLGEMFNQTSHELKYTPRKMVLHPQTSYLIMIETDHNTFSFTQRLEHAKQYGVGEVSAEQANQMQTDDLAAAVDKYDRMFGPPKAGAGKWASCIRIYDAVENKTLHVLELEENEAAFSVCTCVFHDKDGEVFVVVGTGKDIKLSPRSSDGGFIHVYRMTEAGRKLELLHKTAVDEVPGALCPFQGRLLAGVGSVLRIYDLGKKKVLRKCENKAFPTRIMSIQVQGERIYVGDMAESVHYVKYKKQENQLVIFADETNPRWTTACCPVDYDTMAGVDKFGNFFVTRLSSEVSDEVEDDPTGDRLKWNSSVLNGAPHKLDTLTNYHVGEVCNTVAKARLAQTGIEPVIYTTVMGGIGAVFGFVNREDVDFFTHLEMHMRTENPPLCGRDHLSFRSYYWPVKDVIDGDLCEQYTSLEPSKQRRIAEELDRSSSEVLKKLEDMRNRLI
jgi:splicing factor 3B subunit 3